MVERIAIPVFQARVSPVLDACRRMLIVDIDQGVEIDRQEVRIDHLSFRERVHMFALLKIRRIICGGISELMMRQLESRGIEAIGGVAGEAEAVVRAYCRGRLDAPAFRMPGRRNTFGEHSPGKARTGHDSSTPITHTRRKQANGGTTH